MTRRTWLLTLLVGILIALFAALVWLIERYEQSRFEDQLSTTAQRVSSDIQTQLQRHVLRVRTLQQLDRAELWHDRAKTLLQTHPDIVRIERRSANLAIALTEGAPLQPEPIFQLFPRQSVDTDIASACAISARLQDGAYSNNYFVPLGNGLGIEVVDMCLAHIQAGRAISYEVITYSVEGWLKEWVQPAQHPRTEISFIEADGTRLAVIGRTTRRGDRYVAQGLLDLQGTTMIVRLESWQTAPYWLTNVPTILTLILAILLGIVLWLLRRDGGRRLRAEESLRLSMERMQRSARLASLGEMASLLSHELNQPLAAIASYATGGLNLLQGNGDEAQPPNQWADVRTALTRIAEQSERAGLVIKSVNDFVRKRETERASIAPSALIETVLPLLRLQARQLGQRIDIQLAQASIADTADELHNVWCDKTLIEQVILNLGRNGLQAMSYGGLLTITVASNGPNLVEFQVIDQGSGLSPEAIEQLYTPFFTTKAHGVGLGLAFCRTVIEQHGGTLTYTTDALGTCFKFRLTQYRASHQELRYARTTDLTA